MRYAALMLLLACLATTAGATSYEAHLPPELSTSPRMCDYVPCAEVLPGADSFSERKGSPPYVEGYRGSGDGKKLVGYVMLSTDITDLPAYSGKPVVTLIGMDARGYFTGVKVLKHSEPILLLGIPEQALIDFNHQYVGKFVGDQLEIGQSRPDEHIVGLDAITGATVTVIAQNQVMLNSGMAVAKQVGILKPTPRAAAKFVDSGAAPTWQQMVEEGSLQRLSVSPAEVGSSGAGPFIELWFGYLNQPTLGRAILGRSGYDRLMADLKPGDHAIFVIRTAGGESFKGSGFVRGGIYDRVQVRQGRDIFSFRDTDYLNLYGVAAPGAPAFTESAIFIIHGGNAFSAAYPWQFVFLGNKTDRETRTKTFVNFDREYWLPANYLQGGRPLVVKPDPTWLKIWKDRAGAIVAFTALLLGVAVVYANRDGLVRRSSHKNKWPVNGFKYVAWVISIFFAGFGLLAQPSITQVLTWFHSLLFQWKWELFLSDPFIFIFWVFIIVTVFVWGRGLFCGWLCPFGSLTELMYKVARALGLKRFQTMLPKRLHDRLKWVKYAVFIGLLAVSMFSMGLAEKLAEVEPFKTTILVGLFKRSWPYTLFAGTLLGLSIFIERPFCKYLCPLGAALAMPTTFRWFGLKRKQECDTCKACAKGCGSLAIDRDGRIDQRECLLCMDCMILYYDQHGCPPLAQERRRRTKSGLEMTRIGADGYFIPIRQIPTQAAEK
ncbi:MAG: regulatory protein NosR [Rhodocyclaceae bacterium]|nr:regulatory protein NosR [Rhodocyclaceae bacterium]